MGMFSKLGNYKDTGLLFMRVGVGAMMILHGYPKIMGGPKMWTEIGDSMKHFGIKFYPEIWGFLAAMSETLGAALLIIGFLFRPSAFFLLFTMVVAATVHIKGGDGIMGASHAIELACVFFALFIIGPGKYSIDKN